MSTYTNTRTYTKTDVRKVLENFAADLEMLALRTQAMDSSYARKCADDVTLMALEDCIESFHVQLRDSGRNLVRAYKYSVNKNMSLDSQRPGGNRWPCLPDGELCVIISCSDGKKLEKLKKNLKLNWTSSDLSTDYSKMRKESIGVRYYSSNNYGLSRDVYVK